jgi:hypothetical protein
LLEELTIEETMVRTNTQVGLLKPQALPRPWIFPVYSEVDSDDSDTTVEMQDNELGITDGTPQPGLTMGCFLTQVGGHDRTRITLAG